MKKVLYFVFLIITIFSITACYKVKELSKEQIKDVLVNNKFNVDNLSSKMEDDNIKVVYVASNGKYSIEYYLFNEEKNAKEAFNGNIKTFNNNKIKGNIVSKDNYDNYTQKLSDTYNSVTRIVKT